MRDRGILSVVSMTALGGSGRNGFFAHHPRTYPKERFSLFGAPETFGAPFTQNDTVSLGARLTQSDVVHCEKKIQNSVMASHAL